MDGVSASEYLTERERAHMRSLQQRLEQLVVVHRQLLRKFASLELENGEFRKKITLRDERIKQLENNSRGLTGNMRQQAERHVAELTNLREQIQILRTEHMQRMEAKEHQVAAPVRGGSRTGMMTAVTYWSLSNFPFFSSRRCWRSVGSKPAEVFAWRTHHKHDEHDRY
jgi:septal ring factor EnvC (AmiA/AmiB activator)